MKSPLVHMRDQKARLIQREKYRHQQDIHTGLENFLVVLSIWVVALMMLP